MSFFTPLFAALLLGTVILYGVLPGRFKWLALLAASLGFYAWGSPKAVLYLVFTAGISWAAGLWLGKLSAARKALSPEERKASAPAFTRKKRLVLALDLVLLFGLLFVVKYWNFTAQSLTRLTGGSLALPLTDLVLPLGLSFYMFQSAGYAIDCYREKMPPQRNPLKFLLFVSFFPQVVQGPISRYDQLSPQLLEPHPLTADNLKFGLQRMMWGYLKKLVIADRAAVAVRTVFSHLDNWGGAMVAVAVLFYCVQLYCDFSGGIDISLGAAELFGIRLTENFRRPIFAGSLTDYWRRWHITLGAWMRDYLFYPLTLSAPFRKLGSFARRHLQGKAGKIVSTSLATFVVYLVIGVWHGANFRYIAFGFWNGFLITLGLLLAGPFESWKQRLHIDDKKPWYRAFRMLRTMGLVFIGRYITLSPRLTTAVSLLGRTVAHPNLGQLVGGGVFRLGLGAFDLAVVALGVLALLAVEARQEKGVAIRRDLEQRHPLVQWLCLAVPLAILVFLGFFRGTGVEVAFIYQQF